MTYRIRNIAIAVALALAATLLTTFYVANYKRHIQQSESTVTVYTAKRDIPQGTPGSELIKHGWIAAQQAVKRSVVPGAIANPDEVRNLITRQDILSGEQISVRRFADNAEQGVRVQLHGSLRALSVPGTPDALLAGTLRDGDHVDFVANLKTGDCATCFATRVVSRNVLVLHAAAATPGQKVANSGSSVLLAVSDNRQAQKIWYAVENSAGWSLALRAVAHATDSPEDVEGITSMLKDAVSPANLRHFTAGGAK